MRAPPPPAGPCLRGSRPPPPRGSRSSSGCWEMDGAGTGTTGQPGPGPEENRKQPRWPHVTWLKLTVHFQTVHANCRLRAAVASPLPGLPERHWNPRWGLGDSVYKSQGSLHTLAGNRSHPLQPWAAAVLTFGALVVSLITVQWDSHDAHDQHSSHPSQY